MGVALMIEDSVPILFRYSAPAVSSKRRDLLEILVIYAMILLVFWTPHPWQEMLSVTVAASILAFELNSRDAAKPMCLGKGTLSCSFWAVTASIAIAAIGIVLALKLHTLHLPGDPLSFVEHSLAYVVWASIQQFVLQVFFLLRLLRVLGDSTWAAATVALLFAVAHFPSPILMLISLVCGMAASLFFLRYRSLYPLAAAHAILGIAIAVTVPATVDHNMYVGLAYLTYADKPAPMQDSARLPQP